MLGTNFLTPESRSGMDSAKVYYSRLIDLGQQVSIIPFRSSEKPLALCDYFNFISYLLTVGEL